MAERTQRWLPGDGAEFDLVYDGDELVRCDRAFINGQTRPNADAAYFAYHQSHMQGNPAWATMSPAERQVALDSVTPRSQRSQGGGQGNGNGPGG